MRRLIALPLLCVFLICAGSPADAGVMVIAPSDPLTPGTSVEVQVVFTNAESVTVEKTFPVALGYRLSGGGTDVEGLLRLAQESDAGTVSLGANAFVRKTYTFQVPQRWSGLGRLSLTLPGSNVALVEIAEPPLQVAKAVQSDQSQPDQPEEYGVIETIESAVDDVYERRDGSPFGIHEPMFFLYGLNPDEAKFQISFKYRLFHNIRQDSPLRWLQNLNVAYTQLSFWDFDSASKPFRDSSYKPELFYDIGDPVNPKGLILPGLGLRRVRLGVQHESNGRDGPDSRSLNYAYIQPEFVYDFGRDSPGCEECVWWELSVKPKTWLYVGSTSDNPEIDDFRGHAEIAVRIMERDAERQTGVGLMASLRKGDAQDKATLTIDATTPFPFVQKLFTPNLHVQYMSGYSESLLGFNQKDTRLRVGVGTRW
jgi:phospholipase A1